MSFFAPSKAELSDQIVRMLAYSRFDMALPLTAYSTPFGAVKITELAPTHLSVPLHVGEAVQRHRRRATLLSTPGPNTPMRCEQQRRTTVGSMSKDETSAMTNVRLAYASAVLLALVGVFMLVRGDERLQTVLGLAFLLSGIAAAIVARRGGQPRP